ncbi:MAG: hypothetical protein LBG19_05445 [Prevotellaceae bacterium]|jgi:hypothetical protein|nr:hypothetical protein [Prevotellaceae bacterium]
MKTILDAAVDYSQSQEEHHITLEGLEHAFINGAGWMVEQRVDEKTLERIKERQKNDKIVIEVELSLG